MNKSETIGSLALALSKVQGAMKPAIKDSDNPFFKSKYADLSAVWETARALLAENELAVVQTTQVNYEGVVVETTLVHSSGEWIGGELFLPITKLDPQGVSAGVTYGRRAGFSALIGVVAEIDDDGNSISQPRQQVQQAPRQAPAQVRQRTAQEEIVTTPMVNGIEPEPPRRQTAPRSQPEPRAGGMSEKQSKAIYAIAKAKNVNEHEFISAFLGEGVIKAELSSADASAIIEALNELG